MIQPRVNGVEKRDSDVGKSMFVRDLRSSVVRKLSEAQLAQIISDGEGGMPSFKSSSEAQIHAFVSHVRSLRQRK